MMDPLLPALSLLAVLAGYQLVRHRRGIAFWVALMLIRWARTPGRTRPR